VTRLSDERAAAEWLCNGLAAYESSMGNKGHLVLMTQQPHGLVGTYRIVNEFDPLTTHDVPGPS